MSQSTLFQSCRDVMSRTEQNVIDMNINIPTFPVPLQNITDIGITHTILATSSVLTDKRFPNIVSKIAIHQNINKRIRKSID